MAKETQTYTLVVDVYDFDKASKNDLIGSAEITPDAWSSAATGTTTVLSIPLKGTEKGVVDRRHSGLCDEDFTQAPFTS